MSDEIPNMHCRPDSEVNSQPSPVAATPETDAATHRLKTWRPFFEDVVGGRKRFEIRRNDRDFKEGDTVVLFVTDSEGRPIPDDTREAVFRVTYIVTNTPQFGLMDGFCVFGMEPQTGAQTREQLEAERDEARKEVSEALSLVDKHCPGMDPFKRIIPTVAWLIERWQSAIKGWQQAEAERDAALARAPRVEQCCECHGLVSDWVEAEHRNGRICRPCETVINLRAKLAESERDTKRLDWLEKYTQQEPLLLHATEGSKHWPKHPFGLGHHSDVTRGRTLRVAIDASSQPEESRS